MAGNPFRRGRTGAVQPSDETSPPTPHSKTPTKKKVTIQTPPDSPEIPRRVSAGRISPPPPPTSLEDDDDSDSTATADSELEQASLNTRRNSGSLEPPSTLGASSAGAPYNPFARTLATSEAFLGLQQTRERHGDTIWPDEDAQAQHGAGKQHMGVDAFKNILMTGSATPPVSTPLQRFQDSSSSTETSSVSRQSLFDPTLDLHPESPRTSFDQMDSEDDDDDNERSNLMAGPARLDDLAPPAPPKHTPGKALRPKGPQTVSFAEFEETIPDEPRIEVSSMNNNRGTQRPPILPRSTSDLDKPLPPPPQSPTAVYPPSLNVPQSVQLPYQQPTPTMITTGDSPQQKKAPPPPPTSRRARSSSNPTQAPALDEQFVAPTKQLETTPKAAAPPPPPSRKARPLSQTVAPSEETPTSAAPSAPQSADPKSMPPPPPRRNPSKAGNAMNRTSSNASRTSASRKEVPTPANGNVPPAPPPRRGGGSKRESLDENRSSMGWASANRHPSEEYMRKSSATSIESERSISLPNLQYVAEGNEAQETTPPTSNSIASRDVLADMTAFQAEIDALRAKAEQGG